MADPVWGCAGADNFMRGLAGKKVMGGINYLRNIVCMVSLLSLLRFASHFSKAHVFFTLGEAHSDLQELLAQATSLETAALLTTSGTASSLKEKLASTVAREEKSIIERARTALQGTNLSSSRPCDLKTAVGPLMIAVSPQTVAHAART